MLLKKEKKRGITREGLFEEVKAVLLRLELIKEPILKKELFLPLISTDKKQMVDGLRFVMLKDIGEPEIVKGLKFR